jgi:hypothetical protein
MAKKAFKCPGSATPSMHSKSGFAAPKTVLIGARAQSQDRGPSARPEPAKINGSLGLCAPLETRKWGLTGMLIGPHF